MTQKSQVIAALRSEGGFATFRRLNEIIDFSSWATKTPEASVRRIVQNSKEIFRVQPGLWALVDMREKVLRYFNLKPGNAKSEERFSHGYYQGLLVEIGKFRRKATYVPAQDRNRLFLGQKLETVTDMLKLPPFTYDALLRKARTVDVIWFNERRMPSAFYEVEHTTDMKNSLLKFYELQDFFAQFFIVADERRRREFDSKMEGSMFMSLVGRVKFLDYSRVATMHEGLKKTIGANW
jgi:hypothetical protein